MDDNDDERLSELSTIAAIYPELVIDNDDPFSLMLDLIVAPAFELPVLFPATIDGAAVGNENLNARPTPAAELQRIRYLPSLHVRISLPRGYPALSPPVVQLTTELPWLPSDVLDQLVADGYRLWEESGHDQVLYTYIDHLQQAAETAFDILLGKDFLVLSPDIRVAVLDFDAKARKHAFDVETFDCGICLEPRKGSACHRMLDCLHVFCRNCLQDFYNNAIKEGDLTAVRCLDPGCAKKRIDAATAAGHRKPRTAISPSELLTIPIEEATVQRYVTLKRKALLESDKNTIYCPRKWCQGPARNSKYPKHDEFLDVADDDGNINDNNDHGLVQQEGMTKGWIAGDDLLRICEDCAYAFCSRCYLTWHGSFFSCAPRTTSGELTEDDLKSLEYLKQHSTPCPTCAAPCQKTHGCNHMICFRCDTHFCYLCSSWLDPTNPYRHFNLPQFHCFQRLWELEGGDGDDVDPNARAPDFDDEDDEDDENDVVIEPHRNPAVAVADHRPAAEVDGLVLVAHEEAANDIMRLNAPLVVREAPLILQINLPAHRPAAIQAVPAVAGPGPIPARGRGAGRVRGGYRGRHGLGFNARADAARARRAAGAEFERNERMHRADEEWVRRFARAALEDREHLIVDDEPVREEM